MSDQNRDDRVEATVSATGSESAATPDPAAGQEKSVSSDAGATVEAKAAGDGSESATKAGHIMVLPPARDNQWSAASEEAASAGGAKSGPFRKRRLTAMAAIFALAAVAGVVGGSLASAAVGRLFASKTNPAAEQQVQALEQTIQQLNAEVAALKESAQRAAKADASQLAKISDRVEKVEKAQAEPAAKLAKLSETVEKLRTAAATPAPAAAKDTGKETTASIPTPVAAPNRAVEANRLPMVEGWRLRDIANGGALVESRRGLYEVYAGDPLPGLGRVDAIRKQDGRWVVVTSKGLIVER